VRTTLLLICLVFGFAHTSIAQDSLSTAAENSSTITADTLPATSSEKSLVIKNVNHSPKKAGMLSAILPGLGQMYNHKYWKVPIVWGAIGGVGYLAYLNTAYYSFFHGALIIANYPYHTNADLFNYAEKSPYKSIATNLSSTDISKMSEATFQIQNDYYQRNRDLSYFFVGILYLCNILDATVDGHLYNYNIDDDLSFHIQPSIFGAGMSASSAMGMSFRLTF
jgi:hypothetical protein